MGMALTRRFLLSIVIIVSGLLLFIPGLHARTFSDIVAFGDSLSDHGGLSGYLGVYNPVTNPGGAPEVWSNGDVWVEYMADEWDASLDNNAIGGAMTKGHSNPQIQALSDTNPLVPQLGFVDQVETYLATSPDYDDDDTLFTVWIGGNDVLQFIANTPTGNANLMITTSMANIADGLEALEEDGARNFLVMNLPDIGKAPLFVNDPTTSAFATQLAAQFNSALKTTAKNFQDSQSNVTVYYFDVFSYMNRIISSDTFANTSGTYLTLDQNSNPTGGVNGPAEDYIFWDTIHPMTRTHELLGNEAADFVDDEGDDDDSITCFISAASGNTSFPLVTFAGFLVFGLGAAISNIRKRS